MIDLVLSPAPGTELVPVEGEAIVVDETTGTLHLLNPQAALVWSCLDGVSPLGEICDDLAAGFGVSREDVRDDVVRLVESFLGRGIVVAEGVEPRHAPAEAQAPEGPCCGHDLTDAHDHRTVAEVTNL